MDDSVFSFGLLGIIAILFTGKQFIKEAFEKPAPQGSRFDWDAYYKDIENGMSCAAQLEKRKQGGYNTTKPAVPKWYELPLDTVVDVERYEEDKRLRGEEIAEYLRKKGVYREIRK